MSEHKASLRWSRADRPFTYQGYAREHAVVFGGGTSLRASAAPEYLGQAEHVNPEEMLVAAISSCHMLTFLAVAARRGLTVNSYEDDATGLLAKNEQGRLSITQVTLRPKIAWEAGAPDDTTLQEMHEMSHRGCFIANSLRTEVKVEAPVV
jgi:organic hydroperoxide reductase OsmC/OhrA